MLKNENIADSLDFINLKNRIKNEVKRRVHHGDISEYGNSEYDYTLTPKEGLVIHTEHYNKIADIASKIDSSNISPNKSHGNTLEKIIVLDSEITRFESQTITNSNNDCNSNCTGMCVSTCSTTCTGSCTGSCTSACTGSCSGGCKGGCSGCSGCGGTCSYGCSGGCTGCSGDNCGGSCMGCGSTCALTCGGNCATTCSDGCTNSCAQVSKS